MSAVLVGAGTGLVWWWWQPSFPMPEDSGVGVLAGVGLITVGLLRWRDSRRDLQPARAGGAVLLAAALALLGWTNFGRFHGASFVHHWEQFHHVLGAKYFAELGYDGLYTASLAAEATVRPGQPVQTWVRDLRDDSMIPVESPRFDQHLDAVKRRFSDARRAAFTADHQVFVEQNDANYLRSIRSDHGLNATPTWVFTAQLATAAIPINQESLSWYGSVDLLLLGAALFVVRRTYGGRIAAVVVILLGTSYFGRFWWIGGAFLREDWLAWTIIAICCFERRRWAWGGAALAWAAALRVFPVLFFLGPVAALAQRRNLGALRRLVLGATIAGVLAAAAGSTTGRGFAVWGEFADEISRHSRTWLTNNVGLANTVLYGGADFRRELVDFSLPEPWVVWQEDMDQRRESRAPLIWLAGLVLTGWLIATCRRLDPASAAALSIVVVFALTLSTCYYWQMLALLALLRRPWLWQAVAAFNLVAYAIHFSSPAFELRYGVLSWLLLAFFVAILLVLLRSPVNPADPAHEPPRPTRHRRRHP